MFHSITDLHPGPLLQQKNIFHMLFVTLYSEESTSINLNFIIKFLLLSCLLSKTFLNTFDCVLLCLIPAAILFQKYLRYIAHPSKYIILMLSNISDLVFLSIYPCSSAFCMEPVWCIRSEDGIWNTSTSVPVLADRFAARYAFSMTTNHRRYKDLLTTKHRS